MLGHWLDLTLAEPAQAPSPAGQEGRLPFGRYRIHGPGTLELIPAASRSQARACVLSVGIHGNETAPIELLGELLSRLEAGLVRLGAPVLVLIGNIPAVRAGQRFIATNLNRLFRRDLAEDGEEPERARQLMAAVDAFYGRHPSLEPLHYDMHTAIRSSRYPRFAVEPFAATTIDAAHWRWLAAAGIQAVLHQHRPSWTFSHYSKHYHGAQSFTLELGKVAPFGDNDLATLRPMRALLEALIEGREPAGADLSRMAFFRVEHELMRNAEDFSLCFADDTPNFTEFAPGTCLARDAEAGDFVVGEHPLAVVFPNAEVEIGARAALLVAPAPAPS
ncbi:succinylglutamate desuccinylase [Litchfieldella rifensis]|uniref:Succinylglutamate desuccinylase n=1 Tax=Litchfieldella rifensis TaxID=762643 RepID=A0ABV7LUR9_9GAMM